ncbi:hypothetical protein COOONC_26394 [Cooperia oncophora]
MNEEFRKDQEGEKWRTRRKLPHSLVPLQSVKRFPGCARQTSEDYSLIKLERIAKNGEEFDIFPIRQARRLWAATFPHKRTINTPT